MLLKKKRYIYSHIYFFTGEIYESTEALPTM